MNKPQRRLWLVVALASLTAGCLVNRNNLRQEFTHLDGTKEVRTTKTYTVAVGDVKAAVNSIKITNATNGQALGFSGLDANTSGTNTVAALRELRGIAEAMPK